MNYEVVPARVYRLRPEFAGSGLAPRVSPYGAAPRPLEAYELAQEGFSVYDRKRNTYSNYFFGKVGIATLEEGEAIVARLDEADRRRRAGWTIRWAADQLATEAPGFEELEEMPLSKAEALARELEARVRNLND